MAMTNIRRMPRWVQHSFHTHKRSDDALMRAGAGKRATAQDRAQDLAPIDDYRAWLLGVCERMAVSLPLDLDELLLAIETYLDCNLDIIKRDWEGSHLYGACYRLSRTYVIALRHDAPQRLLVHSLGHELGHILRAHCDTGPQFYDFEATIPEDVEAEEIARALEWLMETNYVASRRTRRALRARFWSIMSGDQ